MHITLMTRNIMKGNFKLKVTILLLFLCFCLAKSTWAQGINCNNKIHIVSNTSVKSGLDGKLVAQIDGSGSFEAKLYEVSSMGKVLKASIKRSGSGEIIFSNLKEGNYKIIVEYDVVEDPICEFLQVGGISIIKQ